MSRQRAINYIQTDDWLDRLFRIIIGAQDDIVDPYHGRKVPIFWSGRSRDKDVGIADAITLAAGVIFGAIHCVTWSFHFPSYT
jgi:hypothetical protein